MADYYTEFSEVIPNLTGEEQDWLADQLRVVQVYGGKEYLEDQVPESLADVEPDWHGCRAYRDMDDYDPDSGPEPHFDYAFDRNDNHGRDFWVGTTEYGRVDCVGHLVQKFLKKFRPNDYWSLTYSASCSKPRVGAFGGGAVFVTADKIVWCNAHDFVEQQRRALEEGGIE